MMSSICLGSLGAQVSSAIENGTPSEFVRSRAEGVVLRWHSFSTALTSPVAHSLRRVGTGTQWKSRRDGIWACSMSWRDHSSGSQDRFTPLGALRK